MLDMKYSKMVEMSQEKSREKVARVKIEIQKMLDRKERVTVSGLERATGFSNSFFYRNEEVNQAVKEAQLKQGECYNPKKVIFDMALENKVMYLKTAILKLKKDMKKLERDNLELQKENVRLKEMLEKLQAKDN
jgi:autotransporter adhesin